ncbi:hypothetical protein ACUXAV_005203 [Cupriavidus metallidurans]|jgi:hypothetical protein|uniref:Uncharacterized protein n=2 Tax=Cupriavidus metallidurans TaxID=119219 RepID=Q1LMV6_CUPMC|nr:MULTISPECIES: hypothetical protein [Cupriavidus]HBD35998.1 hypothetical protein [Cupriavidus sp.]ABF08520.1 conserved hypothetical protein [Cupriavidus metallidurans CH34]AVA33634.1 hypothetical protein C3Z06_08275 [Cupriavidus metallidurans]EKZ96389.1 hypothetical protein D769_25365 [Cupriavidus sp. HMR-1]KWR78462.1 hypothetical protein RN01_23650 [Cupriavidus sp. SHE]
MEHLIRVQNEYDRQVLVWLRGRIGDAALMSAARRVAADGKKPYLSTICRLLNIRAPSRRSFAEEARKTHRAVGERYLAQIRQILNQPAAQMKTAGHEVRPQATLF